MQQAAIVPTLVQEREFAVSAFHTTASERSFQPAILVRKLRKLTIDLLKHLLKTETISLF
jgi:hypothetical protein|tara:strand:+ start:268 stop:447 length:180 start_codon:yes stop_codon:yes gene_type:complete